MNRLTFALFGVAAPSDLIQDVRVTPFNIGTRIELCDFTLADAAPLEQALGSSAILRRIFHYTNGHPYLTLKMCREAAGKARTAADIDKLADELFFSNRARENDDNLLFVRERLLRSEVDLAGLLTLYGKIRKGREAVADDETNPLVSVLRLSGIVRTENGRLKLRNEIYAHVFDLNWAESVMPDAELRRQKEAYVRGRNRTLAVAGGIVLLVSAFAVFAIVEKNRADKNAFLANQKTGEAITQKNRADKNAAKERIASAAARKNATEAIIAKNTANQNAAQLKIALNTASANAILASNNARKAEREKGHASKEARVARRAEAEAKHLLYTANMNLIQHEFEVNNIGHVLELLKETKSNPNRGFEWGYWNWASHINLTTLKGHTDSVTSVAYSPDGRRIVTGSADKTAKVWDAVTRQTLLTLKGHTESVTSVAFSPDGRHIVTGSEDGTAKVWDATTGRELLTLKGHTDGIYAVAFSPNGKQIVTGSDDKTAKIWNTETGKEIFTLTGHNGNISAVAYSPNGKNIVTGSYDDTAKVWDVATGAETFTLKGHTDFVTSVAFSLDGRHIVTGSADGTVKAWSTLVLNDVLRLGNNTEETFYHNGYVSSVAFSPSGTRIVAAGRDGSVKFWNAATREELLTLKENDLSTREKVLRLNENNLPTLEDSFPILAVAFSPDGKQILTGNYDNTSKIRNLPFGIDVVKPSDSFLSLVAYSPDGKRFAIVNNRETGVHDVVTGREIFTLKGHTGSITSVAFSPDDKRIVTGSQDKTAKVWDATTGRELLRLKGHTDFVTSVAFSPDGKRIVTLILNNTGATADIWDAIKGKHLFYIKGGFTSIALSADGKRAAIGILNRATILDIDTKNRRVRPAISLQGHAELILSIAFSPDGKRIITGSNDHTAKVWDAQTGRELLTLKGHTFGVSSVAFSLDGKRILTESVSGNAMIWLSEDEKRPIMLR